MIPYVSKSGKKSGVVAYEIGYKSIKIKFKTSKIYTYSCPQNSEFVIKHMQSLAVASLGLSKFIAENKSTLIFT